MQLKFKDKGLFNKIKFRLGEIIHNNFDNLYSINIILKLKSCNFTISMQIFIVYNFILMIFDINKYLLIISE
jgi:hypothetical protein